MSLVTDSSPENFVGNACARVPAWLSDLVWCFWGVVGAIAAATGI